MTLDKDKDVAARLAHVAKKRGHPLNTVVNAVLRLGLAEIDPHDAAKSPFRTTGFALGPSLVGSLDDVEAVLELVESKSN